ncbi:class I SAM-dependent methyltransferase [Clostridioides sp. ZZV15-6598]|uniref:class I SAM-dependent methyltransferase n=1 Tax=Clostridioides sp. ZZV15-6598 TaxID=2811501 RepID=UPI001D0F67BE|nr:class I SAM-dependent methyltransferase [Clostridioides sp. ZZV15-6598]
MKNWDDSLIDLRDFNSEKTIEFLKSLDLNSMNDLEKIFYLPNHKRIHKWQHYFEIYDRHFSKFRNKEITIVEIGVFKGGSLDMWSTYFGDKCTIIGIDIDQECKKYEKDNIKIMIGSQDDVNFLNEVKSKVPKIDILIDDGGHFSNQQITTFEHLFSHIAEDGVYLCEDLHTSYMHGFNGGYKSSGTFIEYSKDLIDYLNAWYSQDVSFDVNYFTESAYSMHYYDSVLVIEKRRMEEPKSIISHYIND